MGMKVRGCRGMRRGEQEKEKRKKRLGMHLKKKLHRENRALGKDSEDEQQAAHQCHCVSRPLQTEQNELRCFRAIKQAKAKMDGGKS